MVITIVHPRTGMPLVEDGDALVDGHGERFPIVRGVPRFCAADNYAESFGRQWNRFSATQIDDPETGQTLSADRLLAETGWSRDGLAGEQVLEVGSGAGRFTHALLTHTQAAIWSVDYSDAVSANYRTNHAIAPDRLHLVQASIYEMPFADNSFDRVLCIGVLQHTPDFARSVAALVAKTRPGGEIVMDFYEVRGFWTRIHAKYLLRPISRRLSHTRLEALIERHADGLIKASDWLRRRRLGLFARFLPLVDMSGIDPLGLSPVERREWAVLDTFDMFSPRYDNPQSIAAVARMAERAGARVTFAGHVSLPTGRGAVVRAIKL